MNSLKYENQENDDQESVIQSLNCKIDKLKHQLIEKETLNTKVNQLFNEKLSLIKEKDEKLNKQQIEIQKKDEIIINQELIIQSQKKEIDELKQQLIEKSTICNKRKNQSMNQTLQQSLNNSSKPQSDKLSESEIWIENNLELVNLAKTNESAFHELLKKLTDEGKVSIYDDISLGYWNRENKFGACHDETKFYGIFECQQYDF